MAKYTIVSETEDALYCVVVKDDGSTFGQLVCGEPSATRDGIEAVINAALARSGGKQREPEIVEAIQTKSELIVRSSDAIAVK